MTFTPYSVSPRRNDHSFGPNPMKNSSTLILNSLATPKWAASWTRITTRMATTKTTMPTVPDISGPRSELRGDLGGALAGPGVRPVQAHHRDHGGWLVLLHDHRRHLAHPGQGDLPVQERHHRDLVRSVHHGREGAAQAPHAVGQGQGREGLPVHR